jgi:uncharacterized protein YkwD
MRVWAVWLALAMALLPVSSAGAAPADQGSVVGRVVELTNAERQKLGLAPLTLSPELQAAAQGYSEVLASGDCFDHTCGPVPDLAERDSEAGYSDWTTLGENLAAGYATPEEVVAGWMASPGHRANMLSPSYTDIGIGLSRGGQYGVYWTAEFGAQASGGDQ